MGLAQVELSLSQYRTLMFLDDGSAAASALADHLAVSRPSVTAVVDGLVGRGLVERKHDDEGDRRRVDHRLTEQGRRVLCQADDAVEARLREIAGHLSGEGKARGRVRRLGAVAGRAGRLPGRQESAQMSLATRIAAGRRRPDGIESGSPWIPLAVEAEYEPPHATIDPDREKSWIKRAMPVVLSHKFLFITALVTSFISLVLQVQIPKILMEAIDNSIVPSTSGTPGVHVVPLSYYVWITLVLVVLATAAGYISRLFLMTTAYKIEFDLRNIIYQHLTRMSFPFYDRVQSGQLISRANSDIRSVQMYLDLRAQHPRAVRYRSGRVRLHAVDQRGPGFRGHVHHAVHLCAERAHAAVDVPGLVADPGPARRRGDHRRRKHQRRSGGEVLRRRGPGAQATGQSRGPIAVVVYQGRGSASQVHTVDPEPGPGGAGLDAAPRWLPGDP